MNRSELLKAAEEIITKDRHNTYGSAEDNFACIASFWSTYLGIEIKPYQVAFMMVLFKIARLKNNPEHPDSAVDAAGYTAIGHELAMKLHMERVHGKNQSG